MACHTAKVRVMCRQSLAVHDKLMVVMLVAIITTITTTTQ